MMNLQSTALALHKDWKQWKKASLALSRGEKKISTPCLFREKYKSDKVAYTWGNGLDISLPGAVTFLIPAAL